MPSDAVRSPRSAIARCGLTLAAALALAPPAAATPTVTPLATFPATGKLTAAGDVVALTQRDAAGGAALLVGVAGAAPTLVTAAGTLPAWAQPHLGTNSAGAAVVIYPRCATAAVSSCDLHSYEVRARRTRRLGGGVRTTTVGETEGVMARGALAFTRWLAASPPTLGAGAVRTRLMYRPVGGPVREVTTRGGQQLALWGDWIAQVRDTDPSRGECGQPTVELVSTRGRRRTVRSYGCGIENFGPLGLRFHRGHLLWARWSIGSGGHYARYTVASSRLAIERASTEFLISYAPLTSSTSLTLTDSFAAPTPVTLSRLSGLRYPSM